MQLEPNPQHQEYYEVQLKRLRLRQSMQNAIKGYATIDDVLCQKISKVNAINKFTSKLKIENRNIEQLITEMETLNISKFLDQVVAIIASTVTLSEVQSLSELSCRIGILYETFPKSLIKQLKKQIDHCLTLDDRSQLVPLFYMLIQLFVYGFPLVQNDIPQLIKKVFKSGVGPKERAQMDYNRKQRNYAFNIDFFWILVREFGEVFCGLSSKRIQRWSKQGRSIVKFPEMITVQIKKHISAFLQKYIKDVSAVLEESVKVIAKMQNTLRSQLKLDGNFNAQTQKKYKQLTQRYLKTKQGLLQIGQFTMTQIQYSGMGEKILQLQEISKLQFSIVESGQIFQDEYQKQLYINLISIDDQVKTDDSEKQYSEFKAKLDTCKNIQDADNLIKMFILINTKKNRKMLVKDLLEYRKQYQLVTPFLCRIAATLNKKWKDIQQLTNELIMNQYEKLKDFTVNSFVMNDRRTRNHKYICQLTKFGMIDPNKTMACIKTLIDDLIGANIDLLLLCLQNVGRFLYLTKQSTSKFVFLLNQLNNVIKKKPLPVMIESQINNCIALLKPIQPIIKKQKVPKSQTEVLLKNLLNDVSKDNIQSTVDTISKLITNNPQNQQLFIKRLMKSIPRYQFIQNYYLAVILDKLDNDDLFAKILVIIKQKILDLLEREESQESVAWSRFFGQMFNYQIMTKDEFYEFLNGLLKLKDNDTGVLNVICTVLSSCIDCLIVKKTASINQKLRFLLDFKIFINTRKYIPMFTQFQILDLLQQIQPQIISIPTQQIVSFQSAMKLKQQGRQKQLNQLKQLQNISMYKKKLIYKQRKEEQEYNRQEQQPKKQIQNQNQNQKSQKQSTIADEFDSYMKEEIQKSMGRIAKPKLADETAGVKKKKVGQNNVMILGKTGNKIVKKEISGKL